MKFIITGHGKYADGMLSSLKVLSKTEHIEIVNFLETDSDVTLNEKYKKVINSKDNFIFICDLMGGTPYKEATKLSLENPNIRVVTGINIGGIIDSNLKMSKLSLDEIADNLVEASKKNTLLVKFNKEEKNNEKGI